MKLRRMFAAVAGAALLGAACGPDDTPEVDGDGPLVVTTVAPIRNIVENVAGDDARVVGLVPDGVDSHTFEPSPSDARTLAEADLVLVNGLALEEPTIALAEANVPDGVEIVELGERTITRDEWVFDFSFPEEDGDPNPHLWMNPLHAGRYAEIAADELSRIDPDNEDGYRERAEAFVERSEELDEAIMEASATIPDNARKLYTYHDSYAYFAPRYGYTVIGAIQPSDFSEPSPREVAEIIEQIRDENIPAIFGSEVFGSPVLDQIARETDIGMVADLADDELPGEPGSPEHTYFGMMVDNVRTIVDALGGDPSPLDDFPTQNVA